MQNLVFRYIHYVNERQDRVDHPLVVKKQEIEDGSFLIVVCKHIELEEAALRDQGKERIAFTHVRVQRLFFL